MKMRVVSGDRDMMLLANGQKVLAKLDPATSQKIRQKNREFLEKA